MKKNILLTILLVFILVFTFGCAETNIEWPEEPLVGGDVDKYGCKASAGYNWCETKEECLREWENPCPRNITWDDPIFNLEINQHKLTKQYRVTIAKEGNTYTYPLRFHPDNITDISIEQDITNQLNKDILYITRAPDLYKTTNGDSSIAALELGDLLTKFYNKKVKTAVTSEPSEGVEIKKCSDTSEDITIIHLIDSNYNAVYSIEGCVIIEGKNLIASADKLGYVLLNNLHNN